MKNRAATSTADAGKVHNQNGSKPRKTSKRFFFRLSWLKGPKGRKVDDSDCSSASEYSISDDEKSTTVARKNANGLPKRILDYDSDESKTEDDIGLSQIGENNNVPESDPQHNSKKMESEKKEKKKTKKKGFTSFFRKMFRFRRRNSAKYGPQSSSNKDKRSVKVQSAGDSLPKCVGAGECDEIPCSQPCLESELTPAIFPSYTTTTPNEVQPYPEAHKQPSKDLKSAAYPQRDASSNDSFNNAASKIFGTEFQQLTSNSGSTVESGSKPPREKKSRQIDKLNVSPTLVGGKPPLDRNSPVNGRSMVRGNSLSSIITPRDDQSDSPSKIIVAATTGRVKSPGSSISTSKPRSLLRGESDNSMTSTSHKGSRASSVSSLERHNSLSSIGFHSSLSPKYEGHQGNEMQINEEVTLDPIQILLSQGMNYDEAMEYVRSSKSGRGSSGSTIGRTTNSSSGLGTHYSSSHSLLDFSPNLSRSSSFYENRNPSVSHLLLSSDDSTQLHFYQQENQPQRQFQSSAQLLCANQGPPGKIAGDFRVHSSGSMKSAHSCPSSSSMKSDFSHTNNSFPLQQLTTTNWDHDNTSIITTGSVPSTAQSSRFPAFGYQNSNPSQLSVLQPPSLNLLGENKTSLPSDLQDGNAEAVALELAIKLSLEEASKQPKLSNAQESHRRAIEEANEKALKHAIEVSKNEFQGKSKIRGANIQAAAAIFEEAALQQQSRRSFYEKRNVQSSPVSPTVLPRGDKSWHTSQYQNR